MARIETDPNYSSPTFSRATAATDLFKKEDVQGVAAALSTHDHSPGKGVGLSAQNFNSPLRVSTDTPSPAGGEGLELNYAPGSNTGSITSIDRGGGNVLGPLSVQGSRIVLADSGGDALALDSGTIGLTGAVSVTGSISTSGNITSAAGLVTTGNVVYFGSGGAQRSISLTAGIFEFNAAINSSSSITCTGSVRGRGGVVVGTEAGPTVTLSANGPAGAPYLGTNANVSIGGTTGLLWIGSPNDVAVQRVGTAQAQWTGQMGINVAPQATYALSLPNNATGGLGSGIAFAWTPYSALAGKTDVRTMDNALELLQDDTLHGVRYTHADSGAPSVGFIADAWLPLLPEVVVTDAAGAPSALDYDRVSAVTFEALKQYIAATDARLVALEARAA